MPPPVCRVFKFGGSSVGRPERLLRVLETVAAGHAAGPLAVVVSAMGDTTDWLNEAATSAARGAQAEAEACVDRVADLAISNALAVLREIPPRAAPDAALPASSATVRELLAPLRQLLYGVTLLRECSAQTLDLVYAFGERLSAQIVTQLLTARGVPALFIDARRWVVTNDAFGAALVDRAASEQRLAALLAECAGRVAVHTGFVGCTPDGRTTTLGRNGSDYTATLLGRALGAAEVVIWTDVSGVMTADPRLVRDAYSLRGMSYMEALELANFGASMFHPRTMIPVMEAGIPLCIRNLMQPDDAGTRIDGGGQPDESRPTSVTSLERQALLSVQWRSLTKQTHVGQRVLAALDAAGVTVWMASQAAHGQSVALVVPAADVARAVQAVSRAFEWELARGDVEPVVVREPVTLLTLVAEAMGRRPGVAGRFFQALGAVGVNVWASAQGASMRSISCAVDAADTPVAVRTVHAAFNLAHQEVNVALFGKGTVGRHFLAQVEEQREVLRREHDVLLKVVALVDRAGVRFREEGLGLADVSPERPVALAAPREAAAPEEVVALLERLRRLPVPVLVDCTAAEGMEQLYREAFSRGIHVVAANKKPLAGPRAAHEGLMALARQHHRAYRYETTVGASLPVIETLKNLVRTGDRVRLIEGAFSGTLGYLANELMRGVRLAVAVRTARDLGYTEPNPADDLSGRDVARKGLILARELGLALDFDDVVVEPLVPAELLSESDPEAVLRALETYDDRMAAQVARLSAAGQTLRYLARIDPALPTRPVRVGPVGVPVDHPAAQLRGAEAFVAFTTQRYSEYPLIVRGAGAGGEVTAAGVLADVLGVSQTLRGR